MAPDHSSATLASNAATTLLQNYVSGESGRDLRAQLATRHPGCSPEEIEESVQAACRCFLDEAEGITEPNQVHVWLRTAAHRILGHEIDRQRREVATDPAAGALESIAVDDSGPVEELIALENYTKLAERRALARAQRAMDAYQRSRPDQTQHLRLVADD